MSQLLGQAISDNLGQNSYNCRYQSSHKLRLETWTDVSVTVPILIYLEINSISYYY